MQSDANPAASELSVLAVAGQTIAKSAHLAQSMWPIIRPSSKLSVKTGRPVRPSKVALPINLRALVVATV